MRHLPGGTVTLLFTDIEGSTRLLEALGDDYAAALADHRRGLRAAAARHHGVEVDTQGDAFFFAFQHAADAFAAAAAAQQALAAGPVRVRIGVHTGEPRLSDEGYVGIDVHTAARICAAGHGGQTLLSERTRVEVGGDAIALLTDLGLHRLKDLGRAEKLYQVGRSRFPPLRTLNATNLPAQPSPLVGREPELAEVIALVRAHRLVTLTGARGSGKTRLALQAAADVVTEFPDGTWWVPLEAVVDPELVVPTISQTIGADGDLADHLRAKRMLLVLDNLEQVLECAPALSALLSAAPGLRLLVTSRSVLRLSGEREYRVDPLRNEEAVELFCQRAVQSEPVAAVREICRRLEGLPLAVELAAARTRLLPPGELLVALERRLPLLTGGPRDAPARQRTLRDTIAWSYELLPPAGQQLFRWLAVFSGGITLRTAEAVCAADPDVLQSLVEHSLVRRSPDGRFAYLETVREFALEQLEVFGEMNEARIRHADYFVSVAESANLAADADGEQRHDLVLPEQNNMRAVLDWCVASDRRELGLRLAVALEGFWLSSSPFEGALRIGNLLEGADGISQLLRARAMRAQGGTTFMTGDPTRERELYLESLAIFREHGEHARVAEMLQRLSANAMVRGDWPLARDLAEQGLDLSRDIGSTKSEALAMSGIGYVEFHDGHTDTALSHFERSAELARQIGFTWWHARMRLQYADYALELGHTRGALDPLREGLEASRRIADRQQSMWGLALMAWHAAEAAKPERSGRLWGALEAEETAGSVGRWGQLRTRYADKVLADPGPGFERGREAGRALTLDEACDEAVGHRVSGPDEHPYPS